MMTNTNTNQSTNTGTGTYTGTNPTPTQRPADSNLRAQVEQKVDAVRDKLGSTLDSLEQKGQDLFGVDVREEVKRHPVTVALVAGSVVLSLASGIGLLAFLSHRRKQRMLQTKWNMIQKFWKDPSKLFS
jgi:hypothetical protein